MTPFQAELVTGAIDLSHRDVMDARERLAPARGILLGLAVSSSFWVGLAVWALA